MITLSNFAVTATLCIGFYKMGEGETRPFMMVLLGVFVAYQLLIDFMAGE